MKIGSTQKCLLDQCYPVLVRHLMVGVHLGMAVLLVTGVSLGVYPQNRLNVSAALERLGTITGKWEYERNMIRYAADAITRGWRGREGVILACFVCFHEPFLFLVRRLRCHVSCCRYSSQPPLFQSRKCIGIMRRLSYSLVVIRATGNFSELRVGLE